MSSVQDIHILEEQIFNIVEDYVNGDYNKDDVLAVSNLCGHISLQADARENIKVDKTTEIYSLSCLLRLSDDNKSEPDNDKISGIADSWLFLS